ncbi:class I SAM-dependent methyltransferase [Kineococcus sp. LSe6-4]|uniref:Class I SAM-dependent methyltransferase n=1 Tax=Kineococcus halophytocola TaxID=3234027 RepID=A0ABV4GZP4_9ACTN
MDALLARRVAGERLEDVLGWARFGGRRWVVASGVFVPRQRSTALVEAATAHARPGDTVLDLGCGTGALAGALADRVPGLVVHATDLLPAATACARSNLPGAHVHTGDLFEPLPAGLRFDVVLANVPYVPTAGIAHLPVEMREHEDRRTLDGGADGLDVLRRVLAGAGERLTGRGRLFTELDEAQTGPAVRCAREHGLDAEVLPAPSGEEDEEDGSRVLSVRVGAPQVAMSTNRE